MISIIVFFCKYYISLLPYFLCTKCAISLDLVWISYPAPSAHVDYTTASKLSDLLPVEDNSRDSNAFVHVHLWYVKIKLIVILYMYLALLLADLKQILACWPSLLDFFVLWIDHRVSLQKQLVHVWGAMRFLSNPSLMNLFLMIV